MWSLSYFPDISHRDAYAILFTSVLYLFHFSYISVVRTFLFLNQCGFHLVVHKSASLILIYSCLHHLVWSLFHCLHSSQRGPCSLSLQQSGPYFIVLQQSAWSLFHCLVIIPLSLQQSVRSSFHCLYSSQRGPYFIVFTAVSEVLISLSLQQSVRPLFHCLYSSQRGPYFIVFTAVSEVLISLSSQQSAWSLVHCLTAVSVVLSSLSLQQSAWSLVHCLTAVSVVLSSLSVSVDNQLM